MAEPALGGPVERIGFEEHIRRNHRMTWVVLAFMMVLLYAVVFAIGIFLRTPPLFTGILALVVAGTYIFFTYRFSLEEVLKAAKARPVNMNVREEKLLAYRVEEMAIAAGLPKPGVYVQDTMDINAFATGLSPEKSAVCFTRGALANLNQEELEGVVAHELAHIANHDIRLATVTIGVVGAIAMLCEIAIYSLWFGGGRGGGGRGGGHPLLIVVAIAAIILAPIFSRMTYLFLSRRREYLADATGAQFTRNPHGLASALKKIKRSVDHKPHGSKTVAGLYIDNPFQKGAVSHVWSTHPPIDERVKRLEAM